jgi:hypothetical protein
MTGGLDVETETTSLTYELQETRDMTLSVTTRVQHESRCKYYLLTYIISYGVDIAIQVQV